MGRLIGETRHKRLTLNGIWVVNRPAGAKAREKPHGGSDSPPGQLSALFGFSDLVFPIDFPPIKF